MVVYNSILVIVDRFTKTIRCILTNIIIDIVELAKVFYKEIVYRYNLLNSIISNKGSLFTSTF